MYWLDMPQMKTANHYKHQRPLPAWYWTGKTEMACLREAVGADAAARLRAPHPAADGHRACTRCWLGVQPAAGARLVPGGVRGRGGVGGAAQHGLGMSAVRATAGLMASKPYVASGQVHPAHEQLLPGLPRTNPTQRTRRGRLPGDHAVLALSGPARARAESQRPHRIDGAQPRPAERGTSAHPSAATRRICWTTWTACNALGPSPRCAYRLAQTAFLCRLSRQFMGLSPPCA